MNRQARRAGLAIARTTRNEWHPFELVQLEGRDQIAQEAYAARQGDLRSLHRNNVYAVQVFGRSGGAMHLAIRRHDATEVRGWSDLQRIKDEIAGPERGAVEVYPRAKDVIDQANMRHLFVLPEGQSVPFTIAGRWE